MRIVDQLKQPEKKKKHVLCNLEHGEFFFLSEQMDTND